MIVFLGLGSNLGNKKNTIESAIQKIADFSEIIKISPYYLSTAWGFSSNNIFLNSVIKISIEISSEELLKKISEIENKLGRIRNTLLNYEDRIIDIDILFYGEEIINSEKLIIPHPKLNERLFVLIPLNEIASDFIHPVSKKTIAELLKSCNDKGEVKLC